MVPDRTRYTPTDAGPLPSGWEAPQLSEVSILITNGFVGTASPFYSDSAGVVYLYGTNVRANKIDLKNVRYITHEFHKEQIKTSLFSGDILLVQSGHIGEAAVVPNSLENSNCHALIVTRLKKTRVDPYFLCQYINSEIGIARLRGLKVGSTIAHVNTKDLKKFRIPVPPLPEQKKIAAILSTWDRAIEVTEKLLANSQQQKKALMQQLLTGRKRLPGFTGEWKRYAIADIAEEISERNKEAQVLPVLSCSKHKGFVRSLEYFNKKVYSNDLSNYKVIKKNYIGFPSNHIEEGSIGLQNICEVGLVSPIYTVFCVTRDVNALFVFSIFKSDRYRQIFCAATNSSVDRRGNLRWSAFSALKVVLPCRSEQDAIVAVLTKADEEITLLKSDLCRLRQEKKALMQQLLTGKRRVKIEADAG